MSTANAALSSRRQFLASAIACTSAGWLALNAPQVAAAAAHAAHGDGAQPPVAGVLTAAEAADVDAICNQIIPGGARPGARAANVVAFIDRALASFFAAQLPAFREGLGEFRTGWAQRSAESFAAADETRQLAYLRTVEETEFFLALRRLTVLGFVASPKYGGNRDKAGWRLLGFDERSVWQPPFGWYDRDYAGFVPYPGTPAAAAAQAGA